MKQMVEFFIAVMMLELLKVASMEDFIFPRNAGDKSRRDHNK